MQEVIPLLQKQMVHQTQLKWKGYDPFYKKMFHYEQMDGRIYDTQGWIGFDRPGARNPGEGFKMDDMRPNFNKRYVLLFYGNGTLIAIEDWKSDQTGVVLKVIPSKGGMMAESHYTNWEQLAAEYIKLIAFAAEGNNTPTTSDGRPLISTAHPINRYNSGTWSNKAATAADLSMSSLQAGMTALRKQKAPNNNKIINSGGMRLLASTDMLYTAKQLTQGEWAMDSSDRNENWLRKDGLQLVLSPYFSVQSAAGAAANVVNGWMLQGENHTMRFFYGDEPDVESQYKLEVRSTLYICSSSCAVGADSPYDLYGSPGA